MSEAQHRDNQPELEAKVDVAHMQEVRERAHAIFTLFEGTPVIDASGKPRSHKAPGAPERA